jgi:hypothetical protein
VSKSSLLLLGCLILTTPCLVRADALRKIDDAASKKDESSAARDRSAHDQSGNYAQGRSGSSSSDDDDDSLALLLIGLPWTAPIALMDEPCLSGYASHPFAGGQGHLRDSGGGCLRASTHTTPGKPRALAAQLDMESGYMSGQVVPATLAMRLQLPHRVELSARSSLLTDVAASDTERAYNTNALLAWRFAQNARVDLRSGLGMRHYRLDKDRWGFDSLYGLDFFARHHIVGRMELHLGSLQRAVVFEGRGTLGVMLARLEVYAGGDFMSVIGPHQTARLGGAVAGVRIWF